MNTSRPWGRLGRSSAALAVVASALLPTGTASVALASPNSPSPSSAIKAAATPAPTPGSGPADPTGRGPHPTALSEYDLGDTAFTDPTLLSPVELRGVVHYPTDSAGGPHPLLMFLHGMHNWCTYGDDFGWEGPFDTTTTVLAVNAATTTPAIPQTTIAPPDQPIPDFGWPCAPGTEPIPNHRGYDYLADNLASWGFVVVSISANGVNANDMGGTEVGMQSRAALMHRHFELWWAWTHNGGYPGPDFTGMVDWSRIGTMGHSRGGEGAVYHALLEKQLGSGFQPHAVLALAPVDFYRQQLNGTDLAVVLPSCDGDVYDLQGVHFYDDVRYNSESETANRFTLTIDGANHNFFNTTWSPSSGIEGGSDDAEYLAYWGDSPVLNGQPDPTADTTQNNSPCAPGAPGRLTETQQRQAGVAYMGSFFRGELTEPDQLAWWLGQPSPAGAAPALAQTSWHAPTAARVDLNRYAQDSELHTDTLGGGASGSDLDRYDWCGAATPRPLTCLVGPDAGPGDPGKEPHLLLPFFDGAPASGVGQSRVAWTAGHGTVTNELPEGRRDIRAFDSMRLRVALNPSSDLNELNEPSSLQLVLADTHGNSAGVLLNDYQSLALRYPHRPLRRLLLQQVRVPLDAFAQAGVDLGSVAKAELRTAPDQQGMVDLADVTFAAEPVRVAAPTDGPATVLTRAPHKPARPVVHRPRYTG